MKAETFKALQQAGLPAPQACGIARAIEIECAAGHEALATKIDVANLQADIATFQAATKADIAAFQAATKADITNLQVATQTDSANLRAEMKVGFADQRAEMHQTIHAVKSEMIRWLFLAILGQTAVLAAAGYFYINTLMR